MYRKFFVGMSQWARVIIAQGRKLPLNSISSVTYWLCCCS